MLLKHCPSEQEESERMVERAASKTDACHRPAATTVRSMEQSVPLQDLMSMVNSLEEMLVNPSKVVNLSGRCEPNETENEH
jgi:hypothetical protein